MRKALVLEGGGKRGAYTAGALAWLIDNNLYFDDNYAISTGAVYLSAYLLKRKELLKEMSVDIIPSKKCVGLRALFKEGHYVAYNYIFDEIINKQLAFDFAKLQRENKNIYIGLYNLNKGKTIYIDNKKLNHKSLKAACTLPIIGSKILIDGEYYLDGGITKMIPIEKAINSKAEKFLIIATKDKEYVRKKSSKIVILLMKLLYRHFPKLYKDYQIRDKNYYKQMHLIEDLVKDNKAILIRPNKKFKINRLKGDESELLALYNAAYADMEANKTRILAFFK